MKIVVIKRDGATEHFQPDKIVRVVKAAGLTPKQSQMLATKVAKWAIEWVKIKRQTKITTLEIRAKVIEELHQVNQYAANLFTWYQKTKDRAPIPEAPNGLSP